MKVTNPTPFPPKKFSSFQDELINELTTFQEKQKNKFPLDETLKIDLHCHDHNSDVPDELLGRILNVPETWLRTEHLINILNDNGCDVLTITNHNNARSCFDLKDKGLDILVGAEFSCTVPDYNIGIHVLTYGFNEEQEKMLKKLRKNIYAFQEFTKESNLPTIWAHPLYHYSPNGVPPFDFYDKISLIFERFEVLNGQRDTWQNMLVKSWLDSLNTAKINDLSERTGIDPDRYCRDPYKKSMTGGSDSHMGIFSGLTGTYLHVPSLAKKRGVKPLSELALEALRMGRTAPYGSHQNSEKLTVAFLDYVCQIAINGKDPGLLRILLHKGTSNDKVIALLVSNGFAELRQHKVTMRFIELFHQCLIGKTPGFTKKWFVPKVYKHIFSEAVKIAGTKKNEQENRVEIYRESIFSMNKELNEILFSRLKRKFEKFSHEKNLMHLDFNELMAHFELPSEFRAYVENKKEKGNTNIQSNHFHPDIPGFLDGIPFPFLASALILAAHFTSARVLYNARPLLQTFAEKLGHLEHPHRVLWLTDTFEDRNGVSMVLKAFNEEIKNRNLPVDLLVCSDTVQPDDHLIVIKPIEEFNFSFYQHQVLRIPDYLEIHNLFHKGEYDRVICSTEGPMGLAALYLKHAYSVKAFFYMHTDWIMFTRKVLNFEKSNLNRLRRIMRLYYQAFDGLFVLNTDHQKWLTGRDMGFDNSKVFMTAHWADGIFTPQKITKAEVFHLNNDEPVILFTGRISNEKGIGELPEIYNKTKLRIPELRLVIAGTGPEEDELKRAIPDAIYLGWVDHERLPMIYSAADLLILPSKFDTFSCVVLESLSCGLPVLAYKTKGPKDIIQDEKNGYLVSTVDEMIHCIVDYFGDVRVRTSMREAALIRSEEYKKDAIITRFITDIGLNHGFS